MKVRLAALSMICAAALLWYTEPLKSDELLETCVRGHEVPSKSVAACTVLIQTQDPRPEYQFLYYSKRAEGYHRAKTYDKALLDANHALTLAPDNPRMLVWRAYSHSALGDLQASDADLEQALRIDENDTYVLYNKAKLHRQRGDFESATRDYERVLEIAPNHKSALQALVKLQLSQGEFESVDRLLDRAALTWPKEEWVYTDRIGYELQYSGDMDIALTAAKTAAELFPKSLNSYFFLAVINFRIGNTDDGIANVDRYVELQNRQQNFFERLYQTVPGLLLVGQDADWIARSVFYAGIGKTELATNEIKSFLATSGQKGREIALRGFEKEGLLISADASEGVPEAMDALIAEYVAKKQAEIGLSSLVFPDDPGF